MPIVQVDWTVKKTAEEKREFMDFIADSINEATGTIQKNVYVYITEWEKENARKTAPVIRVDWTDMPDTRTYAAKQVLFKKFTDKLRELTGEDPSDIVIIFNDIPLYNAYINYTTRYEWMGENDFKDKK
ncbi:MULTISPECIES: tautomerase family protein [unclassified Gemella]|uniref:tautomerase family protein n=1 Tax=unclassified Gemella TaxID=2624949 RepID=UPI001431E65B|nr:MULTISPECIES: tautomerase family protein [unclassified Gemella]MBF0710598.1 tautomerase family protein [Gemella sp. GL1.1]MBF0746423.1 tautomerase family protein [Gemella sp. 19428wG2_WT2a]NYS27942.1 tautomerase family protein [Gemella sp. GL1]